MAPFKPKNKLIKNKYISNIQLEKTYIYIFINQYVRMRAVYLVAYLLRVENLPTFDIRRLGGDPV